jgi:muconolactone D-isomerase
MRPHVFPSNQELIMEFLVSIIPHLPPEMPKEEVTALLQSETDAAIELMQRGILQRIDRVVGRGGNYSIWNVDSLEQLDEVLTTLPMARYLSYEVIPVTKHRVQIAYEKRFPTQ